jgi:hypothetical protein
VAAFNRNRRLSSSESAANLAVVSTKDPAHFRTTPGGYFHGMVAKAKAGELNLDRTLWAMRRAAEPKPPWSMPLQCVVEGSWRLIRHAELEARLRPGSSSACS